MNPLKTATVFVVLLVTPFAALGDVQSDPGRISRVTVYHGRALVTRTVSVELAAGATELVVSDLPAHILPETLHADADGPFNVLSVRYREHAVSEDTRQEVRQLDEQIKELTRAHQHTQWDLEQLNDQWANMYARLREFSVAAAGSDIARGLLVYEPLQKLTALIDQKSQEMLDRRKELTADLDDVKEQLELLKRQRQQLTAGRSRTERQALIFLDAPKKTQAQLQLSYLVSQADWTPQYNLRALSDKGQVVVEYHAVVHQSSGEDWDDISLALSTATPSLAAAPPILKPLAVNLASLAAARQAQQAEQSIPAIPGMPGSDLSKVLIGNRKERVARQRKGKGNNQFLNQLADVEQNFEFNVAGSQLRRVQKQLEQQAQTEGVTVTYNLPGRLALPSRTDQHLVRIASVPLEARFTLLATPLLTDYVYHYAEITNLSDTVLLPGPASVYRDGEFVGKSKLDLITIGQQFDAGFGIDSQVHARRELVDKKTRIQGGNRIDTFNYRLTLSNYKDQPADIRLLDRLAHSKNPAIKIDFVSAKPELSTDAEYLRTQRDQGILRWDLQAQPHATNHNALTVDYSFTMEYDKNTYIQPESSPRQQ